MKTKFITSICAPKIKSRLDTFNPVLIPFDIHQMIEYYLTVHCGWLLSMIFKFSDTSIFSIKIPFFFARLFVRYYMEISHEMLFFYFFLQNVVFEGIIFSLDTFTLSQFYLLSKVYVKNKTHSSEKISFCLETTKKTITVCLFSLIFTIKSLFYSVQSMFIDDFSARLEFSNENFVLIDFFS